MPSAVSDGDGAQAHAAPHPFTWRDTLTSYSAGRVLGRTSGAVWNERVSTAYRAATYHRTEGLALLPSPPYHHLPTLEELIFCG